MNFRSSDGVRRNDNEIDELRKNGKDDLVDMNIETFHRRKQLLKLCEEVLSAEKDRITCNTGCTLNELDEYLADVIAEG